VKYAFIQQHRQAFCIRHMCAVFGVARSGYYVWRQRAGNPSPRRRQQADLDQHVAQAYHDRKGRSGAPRLVLDLHDNGLSVNRKTVAASLRRQGLRAKAARKFKATTNSKHTLPVAPNLLKQDFVATSPNQKWVGDITYLGTEQGWLYLAVVIDLFSRRIIGWAMSHRMKADIVCEALEMALSKRQNPTGVITHSDRGSQYCSSDYQKLIKRHKLRCSMSAKGNCYDNACAESFFHSLKVEAIHGERFDTRGAMCRQVFEYIEVDYNQQRRHSAIGMISPEAFEARMIAQIGVHDCWVRSVHAFQSCIRQSRDPSPDYRVGVSLQRRHVLSHWLQKRLLRDRCPHGLEVIRDAPPSRSRGGGLFWIQRNFSLITQASDVEL